VWHGTVLLPEKVLPFLIERRTFFSLESSSETILDEDGKSCPMMRRLTPLPFRRRESLANRIA
jgi:hypothetical protein